MRIPRQVAPLAGAAALLACAVLGFVLVQDPSAAEGDDDDDDDGASGASGTPPVPDVPDAGGRPPGAPGTESSTPVSVELRHDHTQAPRTLRFEIPDDARDYAFRAFFAPYPDGESGACQSQGARFRVLQPDGAVYHEAVGAGNGVGGGSGVCGGGAREQAGVRLMPGTWTVEFSGSALTIGRVSVQG
jgi:hypothetical protein